MKRRWCAAIVFGASAAYGCGTLLSVDDGSDLPIRGEASADGDLDGGAGDGDPECIAATCTGVGAQCGSAPNGCGGALADCGACAPTETCGAGGKNRCGDGGCDAQTACAADQCGTISNGCGGTVTCGTCAGASSCNLEAGKCEACSFFENGCANSSVSVCMAGAQGNRYICNSPPASPACRYCPNPATGKGLLYCCP